MGVKRKSAKIGRGIMANVQDKSLVLSMVTDAYANRSAAIWIDRKHFGVLRRMMDEIDEAAFQEFLDKAGPDAPWLQPSENGERPGDICCLRATGKFCYEHDPRNYFDFKTWKRKK